MGEAKRRKAYRERKWWMSPQLEMRLRHLRLRDEQLRREKLKQELAWTFGFLAVMVITILLVCLFILH